MGVCRLNMHYCCDSFIIHRQVHNNRKKQQWAQTSGSSGQSLRWMNTVQGCRTGFAYSESVNYVTKWFNHPKTASAQVDLLLFSSQNITAGGINYVNESVHRVNKPMWDAGQRDLVTDVMLFTSYYINASQPFAFDKIRQRTKNVVYNGFFPVLSQYGVCCTARLGCKNGKGL